MTIIELKVAFGLLVSEIQCSKDIRTRKYYAVGVSETDRDRRVNV